MKKIEKLGGKWGREDGKGGFEGSKIRFWRKKERINLKLK
jgi:hypothetical protein